MRSPWFRVGPVSNNRYLCKTAKEKTDRHAGVRAETDTQAEMEVMLCKSGMLRVSRHTAPHPPPRS